MSKIIDLRSDTVTRPTDEMRQAMYRAEVGDDVYGEDPTVAELERLAAEKLGKKAGLFVVSGTMGNQVAVLTHTRRGDEVIIESEAHVFYYEAGGMAVLSGVQPRCLPGKRGALDPADVEHAIRAEDLHYPRTSLICLENTHNRAGGAVIPPEKIAPVAEVAKKYNLAMHLDGARVMNAAVALGVDVKEITRYFDTVNLCLSKGLAAPVGSVLVGSREFIARARKNRKMLGGGMRQAGVLAAAGIIALTKMVDRLAEDHANAKFLAEGLAHIPGLIIDPAMVETNIVITELAERINPHALAEEMRQAGVLCNVNGPHRIRLVTHKDVNRQDIAEALSRIAKEVAKF